MNAPDPKPLSPEAFDAALAEYLAGEMPPHEASAFRAAAESDPQQRQRLLELEQAAAAFDSGLPDWVEAEARTTELALALSGGGSAEPTRARPSRLPTFARYAAVILIAFGSGYLARDAMSGSAATGGWVRPGEGYGESAAGLEAGSRLARSYAEVLRQQPDGSLLGRVLLAVARNR